MACAGTSYFPVTVEAAAKQTVSYLGQLPRNGYSLMTSGEVNPDFWGVVVPVMVRAGREGRHFRCLVGPLVCANSGSGTNPLLDVCTQPGIEVFAAPYRRSWYARLLGLDKKEDGYEIQQGTVLLDEQHHDALANERDCRRFTADEPEGIALMNEFARYFEDAIEFAKLQPVRNSGSEFILLSRKKIEGFRAYAESERIPLDGMGKEQLAACLRDYERRCVLNG
jgi:hypothetical protein